MKTRGEKFIFGLLQILFVVSIVTLIAGLVLLFYYTLNRPNKVAKQKELIESAKDFDNQLSESFTKIDNIDSDLDKLSAEVDSLSSKVTELEETISSLEKQKAISDVNDISMATSEGRLLPCTHCNTNDVELVSFVINDETRYFVYCHTCGKYYGNNTTEYECVYQWNFCSGLDY